MSESSASIQSLTVHVEWVHKSELWDQIKPTGTNQRAIEYITQARADLVRCVGNLERAEKAVALTDK